MIEYTVALPNGATVYTCQPMPLTRADISSMVGEYTGLTREGPMIIVAGKKGTLTLDYSVWRALR